MTRLEYRLLDDRGQYPVLYYYQNIDETEIAARFACDYFVKDAVVYERQSCAMEPLTYVVYVKKSQEVENDNTAEQHRKDIRIEIRHFRTEAEVYPLLFTYVVKQNKEALLYLQCDYFIWSGREWQKTSAELDEDRMVYVIYAKPVEVND
ncbi:hypothetical protein [Sporomusa rhizae]|uniref:hypothetical protein n=1 Tax=Sporomusa rhizae TaxID=357999 RepID=UPI00352AD1B9